MTPHVHVGQPNSASCIQLYSKRTPGQEIRIDAYKYYIRFFLSFIRSISEKQISKSFILKGFLDTLF